MNYNPGALAGVAQKLKSKENKEKIAKTILFYYPKIKIQTKKTPQVFESYLSLVLMIDLRNKSIGI